MYSYDDDDFSQNKVNSFGNVSNREKTFITSDTKAVSTSFKYISYINKHKDFLPGVNTMFSKSK